MKPGEIITLEGDLILNQEMTSFELNVSNSGDRPIQVWTGSNKNCQFNWIQRL